MVESIGAHASVLDRLPHPNPTPMSLARKRDRFVFGSLVIRRVTRFLNNGPVPVLWWCCAVLLLGFWFGCAAVLGSGGSRRSRSRASTSLTAGTIPGRRLPTSGICRARARTLPGCLPLD